MSYNHVEIKQFLGLYLQRNSFSTPEGALEQATNCILKRDGIIEKRPGFFTYLSGGGASTLNNLAQYQSTLMAMYSNKVQYVVAGTGTTLSGATISVTGGRISRFVEANNNIYATTDNGVIKLEAYNGTVYNSGVPPALDLVGTFAAANGPINGDSQVNYRVVFIRRDSNNNLIFGTPSDYLTFINRKITGATWARTGAGPYTVTVTTLAAHNLSTNMTVTASNFSSTVGNGAQTITVTSSTTFTWSQVVDPGAASGTVDYVATRNTQLEFSIPSEITTTSYGYQIYRSSQSASAATTAPSDFALIQESLLTSADLTAKVIFFTDSILDIFRGAELYTNPNSQEGELQASARAPLCTDMALYKNVLFYADCTYRQDLALNLVSTSTTFINAGDYYEIQLGATTRRYVARGGVGNSSVRSESISGTGTISIVYAAHGFSAGDTVYISNVTGGAFAAGTYTVVGTALNSFQVTGSGTATALTFQGITNGTNPIFQLVAPGTSVAAGIDATARGLVKAINRDSSSTVYARYISTAADIPGQIALESKSFAGVFQVRASSAAAGGAFYPTLPTSFGTVSSTADTLPNVLAISKVGEPEAVPNQNRIPVGARNKKILRIFALRDSLIVVKEDGIYRIDGDSPTNFTATILDSTIICLVGSSAVLLNNEVFLLSNQGFCAISNSAVRIISRKIEDPVTPIYSYSQMPANTFAVAYESARLYLVSTLLPNTTVASVVWCYNSLTDEWTTWDKLFTAGVVGPSDTLYLVAGAPNTILKERKNQNRTDYGDESYGVTMVSIGADKMSAVFTSPSYTPKIGDILVSGGTLSRIRTIAPSGSDFSGTFDYQTTLTAGSSTTIYQSYKSTIKLAPYHAGQTNRAKQFAQMQIHTRDDSMSSLSISYQGDTFGGSEVTEWRASAIGSFGGWGQFPFGFAPWGQDAGTNLSYETKAAAIIRVIIPLFAQRTSYIQPVLVHVNAGEPMNIQALGFQVRGYGERVSR